MLQRGGGLDLGEEALGADHRRELRAQHLERDLAGVLEVVGEVDGGHAAGAEFREDLVAVGERGAEAVGGVGHWRGVRGNADDLDTFRQSEVRQSEVGDE